MKWLFTGAGVISAIVGGRLAAAGQDVVFLVRHEARREELARKGLTLVHAGSGAREHLSVNVVGPRDPMGTVDAVLLTTKLHSVDSELMQQIAAAAGPKTVIIPFLTAFDPPAALEAAFPQRVTTVGFPTGMGGWRDTEGTERTVIIPNVGVHIVLGTLDGPAPETIAALTSRLRTAGFRVLTTRHVMTLVRLAAAFTLGFGEQVIAEPALLDQTTMDRAAASRVFARIGAIVQHLHRAGRDIPLPVRLLTRLPPWSGGPAVRLLLGYALGEHYREAVRKFFEAGGAEEVAALRRSLAEMGG